MEDLKDEVPDQYRNRQCEVADMMYQNSFIRDVGQEHPDQSPDQVLKKYASQIEFLQSFGSSGACLFESYRKAKVLAVGSGPFLVALVKALFESGLSKFHVLITDSMPTDRHRLTELAEHARKTDHEAEVQEITLLKKGGSSWRQAVEPFDWILYVSQHGDVEELQALHAVCREERKALLPAMCVQQAGLAGPLVHPDSEGCWESAWRRIHQSALCKDPLLHTFSFTAGAMLANLIVFELLKTVTGVTQSELNNKFFLLDLHTLEGNFHSFIPHPLATGRAAEWFQVIDLDFGESPDQGEPNELHSFFSRLTSAESGIFHLWEEGSLNQLPLSQCRVQAADPLSEGPAQLLPEMVRTGLTHKEARREAGLAGIEAYVSRMAGRPVMTLTSNQKSKESMVAPQEFVGIGAGETVAEGVCRGLQKCLTEQLGKQISGRKPSVLRVRFRTVGDKRCRFYLQALTTMQGAPSVGLGEELFGFPVVWVGTGGRWFGCIGLNMTMALRMSLQQALLKVQNQAACLTAQGLEIPSVHLKEKISLSLAIPPSEEAVHAELLQSALLILKRNRKRLLVLDMALEPFLKEGLGSLFGVLLREEESR